MVFNAQENVESQSCFTSQKKFVDLIMYFKSWMMEVYNFFFLMDNNTCTMKWPMDDQM